jgi:hypothetical protein
MGPHIRSEVFLREDLEAILRALLIVAEETPVNGPHDLAYRRGFARATYAIATACHIELMARGTGTVPDWEIGRTCHTAG